VLNVTPGTTPSVVYRPHQDLRALSDDRRHHAIERGRRVVAGEHEAYGYHWRRFPDDAQAWHRHPQTAFQFPDVVWWSVPHLPSGSDIKDVWEPARFSWVYDLVRAYALTGDPVYARTFHARLASWVEANPPYRGVHWSCGQETAIRALAVLHAADTLPLPEGESESAATRLWSLLGWSGERIADAIGYALSQRNNHGLSEAAGLIHLGVRLHGSHPDASAWVAKGEACLAQQIRDQFADDGWYAQHSFTYMRVALEQSLWAQRVLQLSGRSLPTDCLDRLGSAVRLLTQIVAADTGFVPNHGANDGGRIAPLSTAEYRDFRPLLTLASVVLPYSLPSDIPLDEDTVRWLGTQPPSAAAARVDGAFSGTSGWAVARVRGLRVFLRAGSYRHRPSHMDLLHVDVWAGGREIVADPGTSTYNGAALWREGLSSAIAHNGPVLDDQEPAVRGPRFLWLTWPDATLVRCDYQSSVATLVAEVHGRVRRTIEVTGQAVSVRDHVIDPEVKVVQVTWLLGVAPRVGTVTVAGGHTLAAHPDAVSAWFYPTYGHQLASDTVQVRRDRRTDSGDIVTLIHSSSTAAA